MLSRIRKFISEERQTLIFALLFVVFLLLMEIFELGCPFRIGFGIPCAGCGMTRAWKALLALDPLAAFRYHPAFWVVPPVVITWIFRKKHPRIYDTVLYSAIGIMIVVYIARFFIPSDPVVKIDIKSGLIYKAIEKICSNFSA